MSLIFIIINYYNAVYFTSSCIQIHRVILGRGVLPGLYAHLPRSTTAGNNTYVVEDFGVLEGPEHESRHLNLLRSFQVINSCCCNSQQS